MGFSFVHMADVHLDTPFMSRDAILRKELRDAMKSAFKSGVDFAIGHNVDALLIAGDLFDNDSLCFSTESFLRTQFDRLLKANINIYYAPGNHDPYGSGFRLGRIEWPPNVHVFKSSTPETVPLYGRDGGLVSYIVGAGHRSRVEGSNIAAGFPPASGDVPYVGVLHALVTGCTGAEAHQRYAPCSMDDLLGKGYCYWALGHVHTRAELCGEPGIVYPGNMMGRNPTETGAKGAYYVRIDDSGRSYASFIDLAPVRWEVFKISELSGSTDMDKLVGEISVQLGKQLERKNRTSNMVVRILLEGPCPLYRELGSDENISALQDEIGEAFGFEHVEIKADGIKKQLDPRKYRGQVSLLGKALDLIDMLKSDDELMEGIMPDRIAGLSPSAGKSERLKYLRGMLDGMDYDITARMVKDDSDED